MYAYRINGNDIPDAVVKSCIRRMKRKPFRLMDIKNEARKSGCPEMLSYPPTDIPNILARRLISKFKRDGLLEKVGRIHWRIV